MKVLLVLIVIVGSILLWNFAKPEKVQRTIKTIEEKVNTHSVISQSIEKELIFVPYWSFTKSLVTDSEHPLIYFGIGVNSNGIETNDDGYKKLKSFIQLTPNAKERILAVRMTDKNINAEVLRSLSAQENIASVAVSLAVKNGFNGVLLDYETSAFGFDTTTKNITSFYDLFSKKVKEGKLLFYVSLYGDTYFRARPYDIKKIGTFSDKILIMAYDFSKSRGNPGPNFPLIDNGAYGYSFSKMVTDFQKDVDNQKIVVTLGYFGYDWRIDKNDLAVSSGVPLSTNEITKEFVSKCKYETCSFNRSENTSEPSIKYIDENKENHIVWFEDEVSANKKKNFLKSKGILETAAWAYSYY